MHFSLIRLFLLLATVTALAGCGKKGDLYLPAAPAVPTPSQPIQK